jgi:hypothetical protein
VVADMLLKTQDFTVVPKITKGFHFLGIDYLGTQPQDITKVAQEMNDVQMALEAAHALSDSWLQ